MKEGQEAQAQQALRLLSGKSAVRASEFRAAGISPTTIARLAASGQIIKLSRGLYRLPEAPIDANHDLAEATRLVPRGIVCLSSALAFHGLTDLIPAQVWLAIGTKDRKPRVEYPPIQFVRYAPRDMTQGINVHEIEGIAVRITDPAKTIVDLFRYRQPAGVRFRHSPGLNLALEGLREGLRQRKATAATIASYATEAGIWKVVEPYLNAMTANA